MPQSQLLNKFVQQVKGFDKVVQHVKFLRAEKGSCEAIVKLNNDNLNPMGGMHGGFSATLIDTVSSFGLMSHEPWNAHSVTVNLNLSYMKGAKSGDEIKVISNMMRAGKSMAFLDVELRNAADNSLLVKAEHTKFKPSHN